MVPFPPGAVLDSLESSAESSGPTCSFLDGEIKLRAGSTSLRAVVSKDQASVSALFPGALPDTGDLQVLRIPLGRTLA